MNELPKCPACGEYMQWEDCDDCDDGRVNVYGDIEGDVHWDDCGICNGNGGWWVCEMCSPLWERSDR